MSERLYIIGNGFDRYHGAPCKLPTLIYAVSELVSTFVPLI